MDEIYFNSPKDKYIYYIKINSFKPIHKTNININNMKSTIYIPIPQKKIINSITKKQKINNSFY